MNPLVFCMHEYRVHGSLGVGTKQNKRAQHTMAALKTHIFDQKGMQHDISETIILKGGEQGWLLEHKHCHDLRR